MSITPYIVGVLGLAVLAAGAAGYVQTLRLEAAQARAVRFEGERDSALKANEHLVEETKRANDAQKQLQQERDKFRGKYEEASKQLRAGPDDGCRRRHLPTDIRRLLVGAEGGDGAGEVPGPGQPGAAAGQ